MVQPLPYPKPMMVCPSAEIPFAYTGPRPTGSSQPISSNTPSRQRTTSSVPKPVPSANCAPPAITRPSAETPAADDQPAPAGNGSASIGALPIFRKPRYPDAARARPTTSVPDASQPLTDPSAGAPG